MDKRLEHIRTLATPVIEGVGYYLLDALIENDGDFVIWLLVECESGPVTLDTCAVLSREIGFVLEAHDVISDRYRLNVSSAGLERPLSDIRQYRKNIGRTLRVKVDDRLLEGKLTEFSEENIILESKEGLQKLELKHVSDVRVIPVI